MFSLRPSRMGGGRGGAPFLCVGEQTTTRQTLEPTLPEPLSHGGDTGGAQTQRRRRANDKPTHRRADAARDPPLGGHRGAQTQRRSRTKKLFPFRCQKTKRAYLILLRIAESSTKAKKRHPPPSSQYHYKSLSLKGLQSSTSPHSTTERE